MSKVIGFNSRLEEEGKKELAEQGHLARVEQMLQKEIRDAQGFQKQIVLEVKLIEEMGKNVLVLEEQLKHLQKLHEKRERILADLRVNYRSAYPNPKAAEDCFEAINRIDSAAIPMIESMSYEINKIILRDSHNLYAESEKNQKKMKLWDRTAREIMAQIDRMKDSVNASMSWLQNAQKDFLDLEDERRSRVKGKLL